MGIVVLVHHTSSQVDPIQWKYYEDVPYLGSKSHNASQLINSVLSFLGVKYAFWFLSTFHCQWDRGIQPRDTASGYTGLCHLFLTRTVRYTKSRFVRCFPPDIGSTIHELDIDRNFGLHNWKCGSWTCESKKGEENTRKQRCNFNPPPKVILYVSGYHHTGGSWIFGLPCDLAKPNGRGFSLKWIDLLQPCSQQEVAERMDQQLEQQHAATWLTITSTYLRKFGEVKLMSQITFLPLGPWYITYIQIYWLLYIFTWENIGVSECIKQIPLWNSKGGPFRMPLLHNGCHGNGWKRGFLEIASMGLIAQQGYVDLYLESCWIVSILICEEVICDTRPLTCFEVTVYYNIHLSSQTPFLSSMMSLLDTEDAEGDCMEKVLKAGHLQIIYRWPFGSTVCVRLTVSYMCNTDTWCFRF